MAPTERIELTAIDIGQAVERAAAVLRAGQVVLLPTDTVYGIAALPADRDGTDRLFALKGRGGNVPLAVLCADAPQAVALADPGVHEPLRAVANEFWPGALTMVVPRAREVDLHLGEPSDTIGLRVPDHDFVRALAQEVGPIAATSANRHGDPTPLTADEASASLLDAVGLVVDGGTLTEVASTVIDATGVAWSVLRAGAIDAEAVVALRRTDSTVPATARGAGAARRTRGQR